MGILLIRPYNKFRFTLIPPIGLGYLAKALEMKGAEVTILDAIKDNIRDIAPMLERLRPMAVGISFMTCDYNEVQYLVDSIKTFDSNIATIVGGPHISAMPEKTLKDIPNIDFGFVGESEIGLPMLFTEQSEESVPGLVWRKDNRVIVNPNELVKDLDTLGAPDWNLINPIRYANNPIGGNCKATPVANILTSRGCPFACTFCSGKLIYGNKVRWRSINNVVDEVELLIRDYGIKEIHILDDNFALKREHVVEFCNEILHRNIKMNFVCSNGIRLESLDLETYKLMKQAGFYSITVGIESGSNRILQDMHKRIKIEQISENIHLAKEAGLQVMGLFIIGYPTETVEDIKITIKVAKKLPLNRATFTNFLPLPGSKIFDELSEKGEITEKDWLSFSYYKVDRSYAKAISKEELEKFLKKSLLEFYLRPKQLYYFFRNISSFKHLLQLLKRIVYQLIWQKE